MTVDVKIAPAAQVRSPGPNRSNLIVPVGPAGPAPLMVAVSVICPPNDRSDAWVENVGTALATKTCSAGSLQAVTTGSLLGSPL